MVYLLLDTCIIKKLVEKLEYSPYLNQLKSWWENDEIKILFPETLKEEWEKHKSIEEEKISKAIHNHINNIKRIKLIFPFPYPHIEPEADNANDILQSQIKDIDILFKGSVYINITNNVKIKLFDNKKTGKAPFHNKKESENDALLFFTALDYLKSNAINDLIFVSDNYTDFCANESDEKLHPDLLEGYEGINIIYFRNLNSAFDYLNKEKKLSTSFEEKISTDIINLNNSEIKVDKSKSIIEQLEQYLNIKYNDINFLPIRILIEDYPFKEDQRAIVYFNEFNLAIDNKEVFNFFKSIKVTDNKNLTILNNSSVAGTEDYKIAEKILTQLTKNLIFSVEYRKTGEKVDIKYSSQPFNSSTHEYLLKLKYNKAFNEIKKLDPVGNPLKTAYFNYQIGNFVKAANILKNAIEDFKQQKKDISLFICYYNLKNLRKFIQNNYRAKNSQDNLLEIIEKLDIEEAFFILKKPENNQILLWIKNETFFTQAKESIVFITSKIRDNYYQYLIQNKSSFNSYINELLSKYCEIDSFLNENFIIYDNFLEYQNLFNDFLEGLLVSYTISSQKLNEFKFDDWMLQKIIQYASPDVLIKFIYRYKLQIIDYTSSAQNGDSFIEIMLNLFKEHSSINQAFLDYCEEEDNFKFIYKFNTTFSNGIILASFLNLDNKQINDFATHLLEFLKNEDNLLHRPTQRHINLFIDEKGKEINREILEQYFLLTIENEKYSNELCFECICRVLENGSKIELNKIQLEKLISLIFGNEPGKELIFVAGYAFPILIEEQANYIKESTITKLNTEFNHELYYIACSFNVLSIEESKEYFPIFIKGSIPKNKTNVSKQEYIIPYYKILQLIDLCFKYKIDTKDEKFDEFKNIHLYYDWLFDLEGFDYNSFDPKWILQNRNINYFGRFREVQKIKEYLTKYLDKNRDPEIERYYFDLYPK